jgi:hypothetical protein
MALQLATNKIRLLTEEYQLAVSALQLQREPLISEAESSLASPFVTDLSKGSAKQVYGQDPPPTFLKHINLKYDPSHAAITARKYAVPPGIRLDMSPEFELRGNPSFVRKTDSGSIDIKIARKINDVPCIEVIHFEGDTIASTPYDPYYSSDTLHARFGQYYYHGVGSGVFYPLTDRTLVAHNKIHALSLLGFDFVSCLLFNNWGAFAFNTPFSLKYSNDLFDVGRKLDVSHLLTAATRHKKFADFLSRFLKSDVYIDKKTPIKERAAYFKDKLVPFLEACSDPSNPKYADIYLSNMNYVFLDSNLHKLAKQYYDTVILTHEPTVIKGEYNIGIVDMRDTLVDSYASLIPISTTSPFPPSTDIFEFYYLSDLFPEYPVEYANYVLLSDILEKEEVPDVKKVRTRLGIDIVQNATSPIVGQVIGSYAYGFQTIHTDIDIVFLVDKSFKSKIQSIIDKLSEAGFTDVTSLDNAAAKLYRISGKYYEVDFDLDFFYESTHLYKVFVKELELYSQLRLYPYICQTIRLINQWYYNRKLAGSEFGYLHSTLIYAMFMKELDLFAPLNSYIDVLQAFLNKYHTYTLKDFHDLASSYDIMLIDDAGYSVFMEELARAHKLSVSHSFKRMFKHLHTKHLSKLYPYHTTFSFTAVEHLSKISDMKAVKYLLKKLDKYRLYLRDSKLYIFTELPIEKSIFDNFIKETLKFDPNISWTYKLNAQ